MKNPPNKLKLAVSDVYSSSEDEGEISDDREVEVLFMKPSNEAKTFQPNEDDVSWISCDQILGTLPTPSRGFQGERLY
ncbi:hypothetical protein J6590_099738 [Homalodisca vitripennis]|nr:hypothetical protein J6590_099738 [Homalodisca vitripennis]